MRHVPVLLKEAVDGLNVKLGGMYIDATFGAGGHTAEIERRGGKVLAIDVDPEINAPVRGNFRDIEKIAREHGLANVDGILFDLGVSSMQLDTPKRGFSYRFGDAPLDLRMDQSKGLSAARVVSHASEEELYEIFSRLGEENSARAIARHIVRTRRMKPIRFTKDLVDIVSEVVVNKAAMMPTLSRVFQAIRIYVNDELGALRQGLGGAQELLVPGGRMAVISFHSLEDRIVKQYFRDGSWQLVTKKPITASAREVLLNRRSRSAKLRIAEKI